MLWLKRLQLALVHVAVTLTLVPIQGTLNRVMINELGVSATVFAVLASLPYLFSPIQVFIGSYADRHPMGGLRRTPYIIIGLVLCVLGVSLAPYAAYMFEQNWWAGFAACAVVFGLLGMGFNFSTVSYFSLASEISGESGRARTISYMFFLMIVAIIAVSLGLSRMLEPFSVEALNRAFLFVGILALGLGLLGLVKLEPRTSRAATEERTTWAELARAAAATPQTRLFFIYLILLLAAILGQDNLLEPFAAQAFGLPVQATTRLTSIYGTCFLICLVLAAVLERRVNNQRIVVIGSLGTALAFATLVVSGLLHSSPLFYTGVVLLGLFIGLATVSNLSLMLNMTRAGQVGLFIGAWGMADAIARLVGDLVGGVVRDGVGQLAGDPVAGYLAFFSLAALTLLFTLYLLRKINVGRFHSETELSVVERAALTSG